MKDVALWLFFVLIFVLLFGFMTERGTLEWTFDGIHHVLKIGATK